jgi:succinate dehydrogenase/fumarate reductase-like Fe-S protein
MSGNMNLTLKVWRQKNSQTAGKFVTYKAEGISEDMSFLEMLDVVNESLTKKNEEPIYFDHDCREGICGSCSLYINGHPHGPKKAITTCQLHMRTFKRWRNYHYRAMAFGSVPGNQRFGYRSFSVRQDPAGRRFYFGKYRWCAGC